MNPTPPIDSKDLFLAILLFTPLNAALLTLSAGLIGGCASNITFGRQASDPTKFRDFLNFGKHGS